MNWDVTYDGSDYESCDSNSDFLVEENNVVSLMVRLAEYGETVVPKDLVRRKGDVSGVLNETITVTEKRLKNIKNDFLKSSPKENNAAAGIWKCEKVPSENLIDKRVIFVIKKDIVRFCKNLPPNVFQEGKGNYTNSSVLEDLTRKVVSLLEVLKKCNSYEMRKISIDNLVKYLDLKKDDKDLPVGCMMY